MSDCHTMEELTLSTSRPRVKTSKPILPSEPPIITTSRLILRPLHASDLAVYHKIRTSPAVMKYSQFQRPDPDMAFTLTKLSPSLAPQNSALGTETYLFGVEERSNPGILIGDMGCHDASPGKEELGYMFLEEYWGKGYATEALQAYLKHYWGLEREEYEIEVDASIEQGRTGKEVPDVVRAITEAENGGSLRVLKKCGFKETRRFLHDNGAWRVDLEIDRPNTSKG